MIKFNQNDWLKPYIDTSKDPRKEAKNYFERDFFKLKIMLSLEKLWKMRENIEMLSLSQQKEQEIIWCQNLIVIVQSFSQKIY